MTAPLRSSNPHPAWLTGLALALLVAGCAVGPDFKQPEANLPPAYRSSPGAATNSLADLPWWEVFHDPALQFLVSVSLTNNYDLRIAVTRVEQARALAAQAQAQFMPTVGYQGGVSRGRNEFAGNPNPNQGTTGDAALATLNAAWEVDLWGRIRRLNEASRAQLLATEEARHGVQLSLVGAVATAYFQLLQLDAQLQVARRTSNSFQESYDIFNRRRLGGVASRLETSRAEAALASTAASVPELERQIVIKENEISVLAGLPPGPVQRTLTLLEQKLPVEIPPGLPSQLLERRPDIRQAEQLIRAANAQVGVTIAEFFPRIGLTAFLGRVSPELSAFTAGTANAWSIAAGASGPIFQGGALVAQTRQARAAWDEARLRYDQTVLIALQEVANALISREKIEGTVFQQARAVTAYREAVEVANQRYIAGKASYYEVLEAQQELFPVENTLAQAQAGRLIAVVQLYKALGGGWNEPVPPVPVTH